MEKRRRAGDEVETSTKRAKAEPLPKGWREAVDPKSGRSYYYGTNFACRVEASFRVCVDAAGKTQWNRPEPETPTTSDTGANEDLEKLTSLVFPCEWCTKIIS